MKCLGVLAMLALAACGPGDRDSGSVDAGTGDGNGPRGDAAAMVCYAGTTEVEVELQIQIEESCAIWNSLSELAGTATVTRNGTMLTIDFGNGVVFSGMLVGNTVELEYRHPHDFSDGCGWEATETLEGTLDPASCNFSLRYDYVEAVVINNGGCASPCSAQADVTLDLTPIIL